MKPTKNKVFCLECGRPKMLFESEKKANNFIKFNSQEIISDTGRAPIRSYFCIACNGWHVTSKEKDKKFNYSFTEKVMGDYEKTIKKSNLNKEQVRWEN